MKHLALAALLAAFMLVPTLSDAKSGSHSGSHSSNSPSSHSSGRSRGDASGHSGNRGSSPAGSRSKASGAPRDSHGRIARDPRALSAFKKQQPCPSTGKNHGACPGYTVDHVIPLKRGGADAPSNMQWQTNEAAKRKDKWE